MINQIDFNQFFKSFPTPCLILAPDIPTFTITSVNDKYLQVTGTSEKDLLGKGIFEAFPDNPENTYANGIDKLKLSLITACTSKIPHKMDIVKYDIPVRGTDDFDERYWKSESTPVLNETGEVNFIIHTVTDVTAHGIPENNLEILMKHTEESFAQIDKDLKIINYNSQFKKQYKQFFGKEIHKHESILLYAFNDPESLKKIYQSVFEGNTIEKEIEVPGEYDERMVFKLRYKPVYHSDGRVISAFITSTNITEERKWKEKLIANEKRYRALVENGRDGTIIFSEDGKTLYVSPSTQRLLGYSEEELFNMDITGLLHPDDREDAIKSLQHSIDTPNIPLDGSNCRLKHKNGTWRWFASTLNNMINDPDIKGIVDNFRDITDNVIAENKLRLSMNKFQSLIQSIDGIVWEGKADSLQFTYVSPQTSYILGYPPSAWYDDNSFWRNHLHPADREKSVNYCLDQISKGNPHTLEYRMIAADGRIVWIRDTVTIIKETGMPALVRGIMMDISKIKTAEAEKEFEQRDKTALINSTDDLIWSLSRTLTLVAANEAFINSIKKFTGNTLKPGDKVLQKGVISDEAWEYWEKLYERAIKGEAFIEEIQTSSVETGNPVWLEASFNPIYKNNKVTGIACFSRDITEKKLSQQQLISTNEKLKTAQKIAKLGYWEFDLESNYLYWTEEVYNIWGVNPNTFELTFDNFYKTVHPDDIARFDLANERSIIGFEPYNIEHRIVLNDGSIKWVHEKGEIIRNKNGNAIRFEGSVQDITENKLAEKALKESNERYHYVSQATFDAIWDWDLESDQTYWGEGIETIFGHKLKKINSDNQSWTNLIHPDDLERVLDSIKSAINGNNNRWSDEYRYLKGNKQYAYVHDRGFIVRNEQNKAVRMIGALHDVTRQKQEEHQLKLLESVITHSNDAVMITDADPVNGTEPKIVFVNSAFTKMTGYSKKDVIGKSPKILQGPKTDQKELNRLRSAFEKWRPAQIEVINYNKQGEEFWIHLSIAPVCDQKGQFTHWISIQRNVTDRRNYVEKLEKQNTILKDIAWTQSHIVRAPLTRLMELVSILDICPYNELTREDVFKHIVDSAEEIDDIIKSIIKKTEQIHI
ncbi:MAG TPA: PAS domain S-box protein [Sphingobacteriaceae bacterium]